jgi:hypothetical protein
MTYQSSAQSHLVSISHDPMEEDVNAGLDEVSSRHGRWHERRGRHHPAMPSSSASLRPLLLAGALGLFAAWVMSRSGGASPVRRAAGPGAGRSRQASHRRETGPEGASSQDDMTLDAMNP